MYVKNRNKNKQMKFLRNNFFVWKLFLLYTFNKLFYQII